MRNRPKVTIEVERDAALRRDEWLLELDFADDRVSIWAESVMGPGDIHLSPEAFTEKLLRDWSASAHVVGSRAENQTVRVTSGWESVQTVAAQEGASA